MNKIILESEKVVYLLDIFVPFCKLFCFHMLFLVSADDKGFLGVIIKISMYFL